MNKTLMIIIAVVVIFAGIIYERLQQPCFHE